MDQLQAELTPTPARSNAPMLEPILWKAKVRNDGFSNLYGLFGRN